MIKVIKLAHVGLNAVDLSGQAEFYNDRWGLERIDEYGGEMFFRAEGPAHHVLTLHEHPTPGLHHVALEVASSDEIDRAYEELLAAGVEVVNPPSQELEPGIARSHSLQGSRRVPGRAGGWCRPRSGPVRRTRCEATGPEPRGAQRGRHRPF